MSFLKVQSLCQENFKVKVIIFNHTEFLKERILAPELSILPDFGEKFEECMKNVLGERFAEITHITENNELTALKVLDYMHKVSGNGKPYSGLVVFVSSHGDNNKSLNNENFEIIRAYDKYYQKSNLWKCFAGKPTWKDKPLLFFYHACRGKDATVGVPMTFDASSESNEPQPIQSLTKMSNLFIFNATQPGTVAFGKTERITKIIDGKTQTTLEENSKFIDDLCDTFTKHGQTMDLYSMAVMICQSVADDFENCAKVQTNPPEKYDCSMQMPSFETKLEMKLYLTKKFQPRIDNEQFFNSNDNPTVLFLNYSDGGRERIEKDTELLKKYFSSNSYRCLEEWDQSYEQYLDLIHELFNHQNKSGFFVIFNGSGSETNFTMGQTSIELPDLWRPLLPDPTQQEPIVEKPKVFLFLGDSTRNSYGGVDAKFTKLYHVTENTPNVNTCQISLGGNIKNIPITADLLLCFQNAHDEPHAVTPFVKAFCEQKKHKDFLEVLTDTNARLASLGHEAVILFSTLRKLIPVNNATGQPGKETLLE